MCAASGGLQLRVTCEIQSRVPVFLAHSWAFLHTISLTTLTRIPPKYRVTNCWNTSTDLTKLKGCIKHGTNHKAYKIWKQTLKAYKSNMGTNHIIYWKTSSIYKKIPKFQNHPWVMSLNQTLTIATVYQTHNNNNYPKHNTITININKVNKINIVFYCSPSN